MKSTFSRSRIILPALLGLSVLFLSNVSFAGFRALPKKSCAYVFQPITNEEFGKPRADYDFYKGHDPLQSVVLKDVPVLNQRSYGCCWTTSWLGYVYRTSGVVLSDGYLAVLSLIERAQEAVSRRALVAQGGHHPYAIHLAATYGVIPDEVWKNWQKINQTLDIQSGTNGNRFVERINLRLMRYFQESEALIMRAKAAHKKDPSVDLKTLFTAEDDAAFDKSKRAVLNDLNTLFNQAFGELPSSFLHEGKTYTPLEFGKKVLPPDMKNLVFVSPKADEVAGLESIYVSKKLPARAPLSKESKIWGNIVKENRELEWTEIDRAIEKSLNKNEPVLFMIDIKRSFIDKDTGIMSVDAYAPYPEWLDEVQTLNRSSDSFVEGGHAILITGIYRNTEGKTIGYRVQNSWGDAVGEKGYNVMDLSYMKTFGAGFEFKPEALK